MDRNDLYIDAAAQTLSLDSLRQMMVDKGATKLLIKFLAPNDNSKNQPYLGPDLSALSYIPSGDVEVEQTSSRKPRAPGKERLKAPLTFFWLTPDGSAVHAPGAQIIFYPQYPEARLSGFGRGAAANPKSLMDPNRRGREEGRVLLLGTSPDGRIFAWLADRHSSIAAELSRNPPTELVGLFYRENLIGKAGADRAALLSELCRINQLGWIPSQRLANVLGGWVKQTYTAQNGGGYTLEAELGVTPNGLAEPDFQGWEVKQFSVRAFNPLKGMSAMTLMTPEPDGGYYGANGVADFVRKYGYPDRNDPADRMNFGGTHFAGIRHATTHLTLRTRGFDAASGKITDLGGGGIYLVTDSGDDAAGWSFSKLVNHWKKKHAYAVYVPSMKQGAGNTTEYKYSGQVYLAQGTEPVTLIRSLDRGDVYYDPGIKLEGLSGGGLGKAKARSQFRIKVKDVPVLYKDVQRVNCCDGKVLAGGLGKL